MFKNLIVVSLVAVGLVVMDIFYILSFGQVFLKIFAKKKKGQIPKWFQIMDDLAGIFVTTPLSAKESRQKIMIDSATSDAFTGKRMYLNLKVNFPQVEGDESYSSLRSHLADAKPKTETMPVFQERRKKPRDIETCEQYYNTLTKVITEIDKNLQGINFTRSDNMVYITEGDMKQYNLLSKIRSNLVQASGVILKVEVKAEVKSFFSNVHFLFQNYINQLVQGLDKLMDFVYRGDKRMLQEGQKALQEAEKSLSEVRNKLGGLRLRK